MGNAESQQQKIQEVLAAQPKFDLNLMGEMDTTDFRVFAEGGSVSMWHDIKLFPNHEAKKHNVVNMICEIPRCSRKKYEIATNEPGNPIKQDVKKGKLREFTKGDVYFNYGCLPRTWEDPDVVHPDAGAAGDNDPLDVCEIGLRIMNLGEVSPVKILGTLCLIDEGEADWKMIAINVSDPWAPLLNDVADVEAKLPGTIHSIREWFRTYKIPDGKPENKFGLDGRCMNCAYAMKVVEETHHSWQLLVTGEKDRTPVQGSIADNGVASAAVKFHPVEGSGMKRNLSYPKLNLEELGGANTL